MIIQFTLTEPKNTELKVSIIDQKHFFCLILKLWDLVSPLPYRTPACDGNIRACSNLFKRALTFQRALFLPPLTSEINIITLMGCLILKNLSQRIELAITRNESIQILGYLRHHRHTLLLKVFTHSFK